MRCLEGFEVVSLPQRLPGVPTLRGVPGAFRGVFGTPVNFLSTFDDSLARWASLAARRAESPTCAGGRCMSILDKARRTSCGSVRTGWVLGPCGICSSLGGRVSLGIGGRTFVEVMAILRPAKRRSNSSSIVPVHSSAARESWLRVSSCTW